MSVVKLLYRLMFLLLTINFYVDEYEEYPLLGLQMEKYFFVMQMSEQFSLLILLFKKY